MVHHATEPPLGAQHAMGGEHMFVETVTASAKMAMEGELGPHGVRIRQAMLVDLTSASLRGLMHRHRSTLMYMLPRCILPHSHEH